MKLMIKAEDEVKKQIRDVVHVTSPFGLFYKDFIEEYGICYTKNSREAMRAAGDAWQLMSKIQRSPYERQSRSLKRVSVAATTRQAERMSKSTGAPKAS